MCGNGKVEGSESCDWPDMGGQTCQSFGYDGGELGCTKECVTDVSGCYYYCFGGGKPDANGNCPYKAPPPGGFSSSVSSVVKYQRFGYCCNTDDGTWGSGMKTYDLCSDPALVLFFQGGPPQECPKLYSCCDVSTHVFGPIQPGDIAHCAGPDDVLFFDTPEGSVVTNAGRQPCTKIPVCNMRSGVDKALSPCPAA